MSYTVFARKYRPQKFADLVGQGHVATTLCNAIVSDRVAHAFLFTGVRGVGKTTTARILAKALNCHRGPAAEPCNECDACVEITSGNNLDVMEIDGASNNGVDDVRRLQETLPFAPTRDRYKVVIVDEVHMLSAGAFNAFLKTLEEPPRHVKFIFATTEAHKVPVTIRSRCQRYDFRLIGLPLLKQKLQEVLAQEGVEAEEGALTLVAREAAGSMRDGLTLLDQLVAQGGDRITAELAADALGVAQGDAVLEVLGAMLTGQSQGSLEALDRVLNRGSDPVHFAKQCLELLRELNVLSVVDAGEPSAADPQGHGLVNLTGDELARCTTLVREVGALELQRAFAGLLPILDQASRSTQPAMVLEMGILRLSTRPPLRELAEVVARLEGMGAGGPGGGDSRPGPRRQAEQTVQATTPTRSATPPTVERSVRAGSQETASREVRAPGEVMTPVASVGGTTATAVAEPGPQDTSALDMPAALVWVRVVDLLRHRRPALASIAEHGAAVKATAGELEVVFERNSFFGRQANTEESRGAIADCAKVILGEAPVVRIRFGDVSGAGPTVAERRDEQTRERHDTVRRVALGHPNVRRALELFGGSEADLTVTIEEGETHDRD